MSFLWLIGQSVLLAQTSDSKYFTLKLLLPDGSKPLIEPGLGGFASANFGGLVHEEIEGEVVWARSALGDSIGCGPAVNDLQGKFALIRRGDCLYASKCANAEQAGAKAVIVVNHYGSVDDNEQTVKTMTADSANIQIPCIFICRKLGELFTANMSNGQSLSARFVFPSIQNPIFAYQYATPKSQVDTLKHITVQFFNPTPDTLFDVPLKATVVEPSGNMAELLVQLDEAPPFQSKMVHFPGYLSSTDLGLYQVLFSCDLLTENEDTSRREFRVTDSLWATDNGKIIPGGIPWDVTSWDFPAEDIEVGALYRTGTAQSIVTSTIVGVANADLIVYPNGPDFFIGAALYDADVDNDGHINLETNLDELVDALIGYGEYKLTGDEPKDGLIVIPMVDPQTAEAPKLKPQHWYYSFIFHGFEDIGIPQLTITEQERYYDFPSVPIEYGLTGILDDFVFVDYSNFTVVQRLAMGGDFSLSEKPKMISASKFTVSPNPSPDLITLSIELATYNKIVDARIFDTNGHLLLAQKRTNFKSGEIQFDLGKFPSGAYLLWLTTEEGSAVKKVLICH